MLNILESFQEKFCFIHSLKNSMYIDINKLPSGGVFYPDDFKIRIKKASEDDIKNYKENYNKNVSLLINQIKSIVNKNTTYSKNYTFNDVKSADIVYIFLMIVKYTKNKKIKIPYYNNEKMKSDTISFDYKNFKYFDMTKYEKYYDKEKKTFNINGYQYSTPTIGVENSLTNYLIFKLSNGEKKYEKLFYGFTHFLGNKNKLSFKELDNLVQIFNEDIEENELSKIKKIMELFEPIQNYKLIKNNIEIDLNSKLDLFKIWD